MTEEQTRYNPRGVTPAGLRPYVFKKGDPPRGNAVKRTERKPRTRPPTQDLLPDGTRKQSLHYDEDLLAEYRDHAARIAVDMERGIYISAHGKPWKGGYSKVQVAQDLGFNARTTRRLPKFLEPPEFERAVEWERIRRDATYRIALKEALPQTDVVLGGLLREAQRRVLSNDVTKMDDRALFSELRQYMRFKAEHESALSPRGDVHITINDFRAQLDQLPEEARAVALALFQNQMRRLTDATKVVDVEFTKDHRVSARQRRGTPVLKDGIVASSKGDQGSQDSQEGHNATYSGLGRLEMESQVGEPLARSLTEAPQAYTPLSRDKT